MYNVRLEIIKFFYRNLLLKIFISEPPTHTIYIYIYIRIMIRVFVNVRETEVQSFGELHQRLEKMVLDSSLLNTQYYMARVKGKVEQSWEMSMVLPNTSV